MTKAVESPGLLTGPVTAANISRIGTFVRNPLLVGSLREFPNPPNLDAGEGVRMMFGTMQSTGLYPPLYVTRPLIDRESVIVFLRNENRPTAWVQVSDYIDKHGSIRNAHVRTIMGTDNVLAVSKQIKKWETMGLLAVVDPLASKALRSYVKPGSGGIQMSLSMGKG